jgi:site-specific DNA recombinase
MQRFAFYGRVSTEDNQDPAASRAWQLRRATELVAPTGTIVREFFDVGVSRSLPWQRRPRAAELLQTIREGGADWTAIVIGEPHRAFYSNQFSLTFPLLCHYGIALWVPEVGGRVDPDSEAHDLMMAMFGGLSKAERGRIRTRVRASMSSMAADEGRYLGGRPPFGYRLVDAGPHPNPSKAADGKRLHRLDIDPVTAPVVERVYREYAAGLGLRSIATQLTADGILSPAAYDRARNAHRDPTGWAFTAVRAILANPVYRGYATWGKQQKFEELVDPDDVAAGNVTRMRWRPRTEWIEARQQTHPALVSRELIEAVAERLTARSHGRSHSRNSPHPYLLRGVLHCGLCDRRMQGSARSGGRILYRCEYGNARALPQGCAHPPTVYVREDAIVGRLDSWLASLATPEALAAVAPPESDVSGLKQRLSDTNGKLARLVAAIEAGGDVGVLNPRIAALSTERREIEHQLAYRRNLRPAGAAEIRSMLSELRGLVSVLESADPAERATVYADLGVSLRYDPRDQTVQATADLSRVVNVRVGGGT